MPRIPGISHRRAVRVLKKAGFKVVREGKHTVMSDGNRILTVPRANPINALTMGGIPYYSLHSHRHSPLGARRAIQVACPHLGDHRHYSDNQPPIKPSPVAG